MIHKNKSGEVSGSIAEWEDFYKWAKKEKIMNKPFKEGVEEYLKISENKK